MATYTGTFDTAEQKSLVLTVAPSDTATVILTNTGGHAWAVALEQMIGTVATQPLVSFTADTAGTTYVNGSTVPIRIRLRFVTVNGGDSVAYSLANTATAVVVQEWRAPDGTLVFQITETGEVIAGTLSVAGTFTPAGSVVRAAQTRVYAPTPKVGTTAGWVVGAANNIGGKLATLPASQTGSTLVIPISGLKVGDTITGMAINGSIQSVGGTATLTADLRKVTAAAAGGTDASIGAMAAPLSVITNTVVSAAKAAKTGLTEVVAAGVGYYVLVTSTTAASTTQEIQNVAVTVTES